MKSKKLIIAVAAISLSLGFASCKKTKEAAQEQDETVELSQNQAVADNLTEDANDMFNQAAESKSLMGARPANSANRPTDILGLPGCAKVTVAPLIGFPKTITIDFETVCQSASGTIRSGKIIVVLSDSVRKAGTTAVMTFDNYHVNQYKVEGKITWTNISSGGVKKWTRLVENGKITNILNSKYWLHSGTRTVTQTGGGDTPYNFTDDVYSIDGGQTVTNANGVSRTFTTITPLQKKTACENIDKGQLKVQGPNHYAIIDFGDGTCDKLATFSFDGGTAYQFSLR